MSEQWQERNRPARLERRYLFSDYSSLSDFLEHAAELSEHDNLYPDIGFGRDYVNITIHVAEGEVDLDDSHHRFAEKLDALFLDNAH